VFSRCESTMPSVSPPPIRQCELTSIIRGFHSYHQPSPMLFRQDRDPDWQDELFPHECDVGSSAICSPSRKKKARHRLNGAEPLPRFRKPTPISRYGQVSRWRHSLWHFDGVSDDPGAGRGINDPCRDLIAVLASPGLCAFAVTRRAQRKFHSSTFAKKSVHGHFPLARK
jgi:hypothetical protein